MMQCGWLFLCTSVDMGMSINNFWKLFYYGVKMDHHEKFIGIREFLERSAVDCFNNSFKTDIRKPAKNTPSLDDIDNEITGSTCRILSYSSPYPNN